MGIFTLGGSLEAVQLGALSESIKGSLTGLDTVQLQAMVNYVQAGVFGAYAKTSQNGRGQLNPIAASGCR